MITHRPNTVLELAGGFVEPEKPLSPALGDAHTVVAWIHPRDGAADGVILATAGWTLAVAAGRLRVTVGGPHDGRYVMPDAGAPWIAVAVVVDPAASRDQMRLYVNGGLDAAWTLAAPLPASTTLRLGAETGGFSGSVRRVSVWKGAHSAWRIKQEVNNDPIPGPDLLVDWLMQPADGAATRVSDVSGNERHGVLRGKAELARRLQAAAPLLRAADSALPGVGAAPVASLPPSGRTGEAERFLKRVELHGRQRVQEQRAKAAEKVLAAKTDAGDTLDDAHRVATRAAIASRFEQLFSLQDGRIHRLDNGQQVEWLDQRRDVRVIHAQMPAYDTGIMMTPDTRMSVTVEPAPGSAPWVGNMSVSTLFVGTTGFSLTMRPAHASREITGVSGPLTLTWRDVAKFNTGCTLQITMVIQRKYPGLPASDIALDPLRKRLFWAQVEPPYALYSMDLTTSVATKVVPGMPQQVIEMAMDGVLQRLAFLTTAGIFTAGFSDLAKAYDVGPTSAHPPSLAVDEDNHVIYWTNDFGIWRGPFGGGTSTLIVPAHEAPSPVDLAVDGEAGFLYWSDAVLKRVRRSDLAGNGIVDLYTVESPMRGLTLDEISPEMRSQLKQDVYWACREERDGQWKHFLMRGPIDGSGPTDHLAELRSDGSVCIFSQARADHERRLVAYAARRAAVEKAAADAAKAHEIAASKVAAKHGELETAHSAADVKIANKAADHEQARADNRQRVVTAQATATQRVDTARSNAARTRSQAQANAQTVTNQANADAASIRGAAEANRARARAERDKHR